ncbi:MAG: DUF5615 family PIN-like protein [Cyanobacteria bacterium P01_G01_bin.39]
MVYLLRKAGHDVMTINELKLRGTDDPVVLDCSRKQNRVLLTKNCKDFQALHQLNPTHPGIVAITQYNNPAKDMSSKDIVKAISNLETVGTPVANKVNYLNKWNY